VTEAGLDQQV